VALDHLPSGMTPDACRLVLIDGRLEPTLSSSRLPPGLELVTLASELARVDPATAGGDFGADATSTEDRLRFLNTCLLADGLILKVAANRAIETPIELVLADSGGASYPRVHLALAANAALTVLERHVSLADAPSTSVSCLDATIGPGARLTHTLLSTPTTKTVRLTEQRILIDRDGHYAHRAIALSGQLTRLDLRVRLQGTGAEASLAGLFFAEQTQEHHVRTLVEHGAPHTRSDQVYRGVAGDRGLGSYDGKVVVHPHAQKTDSRQSSRNLLLSRDAEIDARPQLEINADDVKCSHGATTGTLDDRMQFYLLSRGLDPKVARALLTYAFMGDVLKTLHPRALRGAVEAEILKRLPDAALLSELAP
jgi:Fe-S cluster assembly protein SufD